MEATPPGRGVASAFKNIVNGKPEAFRSVRRQSRKALTGRASQTSGADGLMLITTDFDAGVWLLSAKLRTGTSTFVSGK